MRGSITGGDSIAAQRQRLLAVLERGDFIARAELERACDVPSVTKRISELRDEGWPIEGKSEFVSSRHGLRRTTFYRLTGPRAQRDLFEAATVSKPIHPWGPVVPAIGHL